MPILFRNPGLIDLRALTTLGVNAKPGSTNPIGFFGTGAKFAIATLLRLNCTVTLFRCADELERFDFTLKPVEIRGEQFQIVCLNDQELNFTSAFGRKWEAWQAFRELYSNALDENGTTEQISAQTDWHPEPGETAIIVTGDVIEDAWRKRAETILMTKPLFETPACDLHPHSGQGVFYRGIHVFSFGRHSTYTFNVKRSIELTEDRTAKYPHQIQEAVGEALDFLADHDQRDVCEAILCADKRMADANELNFNGIIATDNRSDKFLDLVGELRRTRALDLNPTANEAFKRLRGQQTFEVELFIPSDVQAQMLTTATAFCKKLGYAVDDFPIFPAERLGNGCLGLAKDGKIYVSRECFDHGTKLLAGTLIEEWCHLRFRHDDCTRGMQNWLFNQLCTLGEEHVWKAPL